MNVFIGTEIFSTLNSEPINKLSSEGLNFKLNPLDRQLISDDYVHLNFEDFDYIIAGIEPYNRKFFIEYPRVKVISRIGIGLDSIDLDSAEEFGVSIYNTPEAPSRSVAELTIGHIISLSRGIIEMNNDGHNKKWNPVLGREISGMTIGLLGFGRIGKLVAELLQPFNCKVISYDIKWDYNISKRLNVKRVSFEELLKESDILSIHVPLEDSTNKMINNSVLDLMKETSSIINTSRGGIVDDIALVDRLKSGKLKSAALDVFEYEPDLDRYAGVSNLIISHHSASNTLEARHRMEIGAVNNLINHIRGLG